MLSATFELAAAFGLVSLWAYGARAWLGGAATGFLTAMAAGGLYVAKYMDAWLPFALAVGLAGGIVLFVFGGRKPAASALFAIEFALAVLQVAFVMLNV